LKKARAEEVFLYKKKSLFTTKESYHTKVAEAVTREETTTSCMKGCKYAVC
jgi:hypothetical protein